MRKGFTLIEIAIVLVIIGLLVSMTVAGYNLRRSAMVKREIKKIRKIEIAYSTYRNLYPDDDMDLLYRYPKQPVLDTKALKQSGFLGEEDLNDNFLGANLTSGYYLVKCTTAPFDEATSALDGNTGGVFFNQSSRSVCIISAPKSNDDKPPKAFVFNKNSSQYLVCNYEKNIDDLNTQRGAGRFAAPDFKNSATGFRNTLKDINECADYKGIESNKVYAIKIY